MRLIGESFAAPEQRPGLLVQGDDGPLRSARSGHHPAAVQQNRFGIAPLGAGAAEILHVVFPPQFLAVGSVQAHQFTVLAHGIDAGAIHGGGGARPIKPGFSVSSSGACLA